MKIALLGDSIFDNGSYVNKGESVIEQLAHMISGATLLAIDGDVTTDVFTQLEKLPNSVEYTFLSCGGNDALKAASLLEKPASTVGDAFQQISTVLKLFREKYQSLLEALTAKTGSKLTICTIYNNVPGISIRAKTALALFNEVILEEAIKKGTSIIDLRVICKEEEDFSEISPIEPSGLGARKIALKVVDIVTNKGRHANLYY